ncbi:IpaC/SipC family type III secretion system effector, partial [Burkholderia ubonensis]|uniref:IpaC/SipC family type III secretion system effector n=1 Tax=Burkholderia ubonensis TaxID=101571 RepID=UPI000A4DA4F0
GETAHYEIDGGGDRLSSEHEAVLAKDAPARQQRIDMHGLRHEQNLIEANRYQIKGNLIQSGGQIGKNQIDAVSAQQKSEARAEQKTDESTQQILTAASNARHEAAQRCREAAQKAIDAAKSLVANSNAVAAQVTGNLRT